MPLFKELRKRKLSEIEKRRLFKRNRKVVNRVVRGFLAKNKVGIVHGTRATNAQLPRDLQRKTLDWDVFVKNPKRRARQLEKALDKKFRFDAFKVKEGTGSPGVKVFKVKSNVTDEGFVDFATPGRMVPSVSKRGVQFATLRDQRNKAIENVKKSELKFRRPKDRDLLRRIKLANKGRRVE